jgi:hypothetical protein
MGQLIASKAEQEVTEIGRTEMHRGWDMKRAMAAGAAMLEAVPAALGLSPVAAGAVAVGTAAVVGGAAAPSLAQTETLRSGFTNNPLIASNAGVATGGSLESPPYRVPLIGGMVSSPGVLEGMRAIIVSTDGNAPTASQWSFTSGVVSAFTGSSVNLGALTSYVSANIVSSQVIGAAGSTRFYDTNFTFSSGVPVNGAFYGALGARFENVAVQGIGFATGVVSPFSLQAPDARISTGNLPPYVNTYTTLSQMGTPTDTFAVEYVFRPASSNAAAPEPTSVALMGSLGALAVSGMLRRRK